MENNNKKLIIIVAIIVVVIVAAGLVWYGVKIGWQTKLDIPSLGEPAGAGLTGAKSTGLSTIQGGTRDKISQTIKTPEPNATSTNPDVAVPKSSLNLGGGTGVSASLRDFEIKAENGKFSPSTIVVDEMDVITISLAAVDKNYNIFFPDFGVYREAAKGQTTKFQFQAYPFGQYKFYCKDICGSSAAGTLIVNKK